MSLLYPDFLWASGLAAAAILGIHWLTTRERTPASFPTLRFIPEGELRASALRLRLSDRRLLLLRLLIVLLLGLAFAQPHWVVPGSVARVVLIDGSGSVARTDAWREQIRSAATGADAVLVYGEGAREVDGAALGGALNAAPPAGPVGALSPALLTAIRVGNGLRNRAETVELDIHAPFLAAAFDAATPGIRALWPGPVRLHRVEAAEPQAAASRVELHWAGSSEGTEQTVWLPRPAADMQNGVHTLVTTLIAPFERRWQLAAPLDPDIRVVAWWLDGEPAAVERLRDGVRQTWLGFAMPEKGDAVLRPAFVRFMEWLESPARAPFGMVPMAADQLEAFAQPPRPSRSAAEARPAAFVRPIALGLLGLALLLLCLEPLLRRRMADRRKPPTDDGAAS